MRRHRRRPQNFQSLLGGERLASLADYKNNGILAISRRGDPSYGGKARYRRQRQEEITEEIIELVTH